MTVHRKGWAMMISKKRILQFLPALGILYGGNAIASCPPILPCTEVAEASTIAGSNAHQEILEMTAQVAQDGQAIATAITDMSKANSVTINSAAQNLIATNIEMSQIQMNQTLQTEKAMADREMSHKAQMAESAYRASTSVVSPDDTKEEFQLILDYLAEYSDRSVPEIVMMLQETIDKDDEMGKVLVPIKASEGICDPDEVAESGACAIAKRIFPAQKLQALFKQCSADKRMLIEDKKINESRVAAIELANKKTAQAMSSTSASGSISSRMEQQRELSCSPSEYRSGQCGEEMTAEDYQESIIIGNIVPNGDVSASNFTSPSSSSAEGYLPGLTEETKEDIRMQSLDRESFTADPNQKVVDITHTYRNANQVKAAMNFIDNLVADDLVPALRPEDRRRISNAEYQSRYLSRIAALSMVRLALSDSMSQRVGDKMREMMLNGEIESTERFEIAIDSPDNKESVTGAGALDLLADRVAQQSSNMQLSSQNGGSTNAGNDFIAAPSESNATAKILESLHLQNEMALKEYLLLEQSNAMDAIMLSQKVNSPSMTKLMEKLRRGN
jgi:hypothetical protein